jgi:hypothetical protein
MLKLRVEQEQENGTSSAVVDLLRSYNSVVDVRQGLRKQLHDIGIRITTLKTEIKKSEEREKEISTYAIVGQIYHTFQEHVINVVYCSENVPIYRLDEMLEDLQDDYVGHHDSIFKSLEERDEAAKKWESLKEKIGWNEDGPFYDMHGLEYLEDYQYGIGEPRLTAAGLKDILEKARNREWFSEKVLKLFERFISMSEKISVHVM